LPSVVTSLEGGEGKRISVYQARKMFVFAALGVLGARGKVGGPPKRAWKEFVSLSNESRRDKGKVPRGLPCKREKKGQGGQWRGGSPIGEKLLVGLTVVFSQEFVKDNRWRTVHELDNIGLRKQERSLAA